MLRLLFYIILAIDLVGAFILLYSLARVPSGKTRRFFLFFMGVSLLWINSMFLIQHPGLSTDTANLLSRLIFAAGIVAMYAYGYFVIYFCDRKQEFRSARFIAFQVNQLLLLILLGTGLITDGIRENAAGLRSPVYGPAHPYFVLSWIFWGLYVFAVGHYGYRRARDPVFRFQIRYLFYSGLVTFAFMVVMIGLLPRVTRLPWTSYAGGFSCLVLYWGVINLLVNERSLFIRGAVSELLKRPAFRLRENVRALYRTLYTIGRSFDTDELDQRISFALAGDAHFELRLSRGGRAGGGESLRNRVLNLFQSEKYIAGLIESQKNTQKENLRLALKIEELTRKLRGGPANQTDQDLERLPDQTLRVLAAQIDPDFENLDEPFSHDTALDALDESEFNELLLCGFIEPAADSPGVYRFTRSGRAEIEAGDDRPFLDGLLELFESPPYSLASRTHAPRWHLSDRFAAGGGGCARILEIVSEDGLGEPEDFKHLREFSDVSLHYGYQGSEISLSDSREPYNEIFKAIAYDIFIGDGTYQFDCFYKMDSRWAKVRVEFVPGLTPLSLPAGNAASVETATEGIFLLENSRSAVMDASRPDTERLTVAVREQYRRLGSLGDGRSIRLRFQLARDPDDFALFIGTGHKLEKLSMRRQGSDRWEGVFQWNGFVLRAVLSTEGDGDYSLVVTREGTPESEN